MLSNPIQTVFYRCAVLKNKSKNNKGKCNKNYEKLKNKKKEKNGLYKKWNNKKNNFNWEEECKKKGEEDRKRKKVIHSVANSDIW